MRACVEMKTRFRGKLDDTPDRNTFKLEPYVLRSGSCRYACVFCVLTRMHSHGCLLCVRELRCAFAVDS